LFLACQNLNSGKYLDKCEDQSWLKVQAVPVFLSIDVRYFHLPPKTFSRTLGGVRMPQFEDHCYIPQTLLFITLGCSVKETVCLRSVFMVFFSKPNSRLVDYN
jgi:hypothetical protein